MPLRQVDNIAMGDFLHSVAVSRDGTQLYVAVDSDNCISIVDLATGGIAGRVDLPGSPMDIAVSPNGSTALVVGLQRESMGDRGRAYVIDLRTKRLIAAFAAGFNPQSVVFSPQGTFAYICDFSSDDEITPGEPGRQFRLRVNEIRQWKPGDCGREHPRGRGLCDGHEG
jgi:DNA-binding beta-propeller fold protein YncE